MHQANDSPNPINQKSRTAIGNVNTEASAALIRDQSIAVLKTFVFADARIDDTDLFPVDLLRGNERHPSETMFTADFLVHAVERGERGCLVVRHLDTGHAQGESMNDARQRAQRLELFSRKLTVVHLPELVVRVVRVVVVLV